MRTYLSRSWISSMLAGGPSRIHGVGVVATQPIAKGEKLMEFGGLPIDRAEADGDDYRTRSVWQVGDDLYLALREDDPEPSLDENLNHSCDANSWLVDEVTLVARRDIGVGEEITLDQGTWNHDEDDYTWDQDNCSCGSPCCRTRLTEHDWRLAEVQQRYRGHFHPLVARMIAALKPQDG